MAITNAQQFKQLVNPPMDGKKRPGYRGDDAYGGGDQVAGGGDQGFGGDGPPGPDDRSTAQQTANQRAQVRAGNVRAIENLIDRPNLLERGLDLYSKFSPLGLITRGITKAFSGSKDPIDPYSGGKTGLHYEGPTTTDDDGRGNGNDGQNIIPLIAQAPVTSGAETVEDTDVVTSAPRIAYRLMNEGGMADDRMPYEGGIMDLESARQMYGLGKLVKKVTRSVKKIAKSPIGKAALLYAGTAGLGALGAGAARAGTGFGIFAPSAVGSNLATSFARLKGASLFNKGIPRVNLNDYDPARNIFQKGFDFIRNTGTGKAMLGIGALSALPLLGVGVEDEEEQKEFSPYLGEGLDIAAIRANPRKYQGQAYRLMSDGGDTEDAKKEEDLSKDPNYKGWKKTYEINPDAAAMNENHSRYLQFYNKKAEGGSMKEPVAKKVMPLLDLEGQEMDFRQDGGFVPIGRMEKADDVPARLSKNEFVFTAEAVRNAGEGDIDKGAEVMYNMMKNLESGGEVSEESQGLEGARKMFQTSQRLEEVL